MVAGRMRQRLFKAEYSTDSNQPPHASRLSKCSASLNGGPPFVLPMIVPRGIVGVMRRQSWSSLYVARCKRGRLGFVVRGVLDREQDTLIGFVGKLPQ